MEEVQVKHLCGVCKQEFDTEEEYLSHVCEVTEASPTDPEHLIKSTTPNFEEISQAALQRGAEAQKE